MSELFIDLHFEKDHHGSHCVCDHHGAPVTVWEQADGRRRVCTCETQKSDAALHHLSFHTAVVVPVEA